MSPSWRTYSSAPKAGTFVCSLHELADGEALCIDVASPRGTFPLVLVRRSDAVHAFVNACPHQDLPLNHRSSRVLTACGRKLVCSAHGAVFDATSGACLSSAVGGLEPVPVVEDLQGNLHIGS